MKNLIFILFLLSIFSFSIKSISSERLSVLTDIKNIQQLQKSEIINQNEYLVLLDKVLMILEDDSADEINNKIENFKSIISLFESKILNEEETLIKIEILINELIYLLKENNDDTVHNLDTKKVEEKKAAVAAAKKAQEEANTNDEVKEVISDYEKIEIGKVLKVKRGKGFAGDKKLKKKNKVLTNTIYTTLAGGDLAFMLDEKTRIFMGNESEILIKSFLIPEKKSHEVHIQLIKGSFLYQSLRKTNTKLIVEILRSESFQDKIILKSNGFETSVAFNFRQNEKDIRFVNAGQSNLIYLDNNLSKGDYGVIDQISGSLSLNSLPNKNNDGLIGTALEDYSMTIMGMPNQTDSGGGGSGEGGGGAGGCG